MIKNGITQVYSRLFSIWWIFLSDLLFFLAGLIVALIIDEKGYFILLAYWSVIFFLVDARYMFRVLHNSFLYSLLVLFLMLNMMIWLLISQSNSKKKEQFKVIALKVAVGERIGYDLLTEENLLEIDRQIKADTIIKSYVRQHPDIDKSYLHSYLKNNYFGNTWQSYDMSVDVVGVDLINKIYTKEKWDNIDYKFSDPRFFKMRTPGSCTYKGIYKTIDQNGDSIAMYINLIRKDIGKKMAYPEMDIRSNGKNPWRRVSSALFYDENLILSNGNFSYSPIYYFKNKWPTRYYNAYIKNHQHYSLMIYPYRRVVVSEECNHSWRSYMVFITYIFCVMALMSYALNAWIKDDFFIVYTFKGSIFNRFQHLFFVFSFVCIFLLMLLSMYLLSSYKYSMNNNNIKQNLNFVKEQIEKNIRNIPT